MKKQIYLIQGIIFQENPVLKLANKQDVEFALEIAIAMMFTMFHGIVGPLNEGEGFGGQMHDRWGDSLIVDFKINEDELEFTKKYEKRPPIFYSFKKGKGDVWIGGWHGPDCGNGKCKCVVVSADEAFLVP